jgi:FtsH-binding integral membrane protein
VSDEAQNHDPDSPQQRRRRSMSPKAVFTVAMAGPDVQRRFVLLQRSVFALIGLAGLASMLLGALVLPRPDHDLLWPLAGGAAFLLVLSAISRFRTPWLQAASFVLGTLATGLIVGWTVPAGPQLHNTLLNPALVIGTLLVGGMINGLLYKTDRSPLMEYLMTGPWLLVALAIAWFFPAGEWVLGISGALALVLMYCMLRSSREALPLHQPSEVVAAAVDVVPLACIASFAWMWGRD